MTGKGGNGKWGMGNEQKEKMAWETEWGMSKRRMQDGEATRKWEMGNEKGGKGNRDGQKGNGKWEMGYRDGE